VILFCIFTCELFIHTNNLKKILKSIKKTCCDEAEDENLALSYKGKVNFKDFKNHDLKKTKDMLKHKKITLLELLQ